MLVAKMLGAPKGFRRKGWVPERRSVKNESKKERPMAILPAALQDRNPKVPNTMHDTKNSPIKIPKAEDPSVRPWVIDPSIRQ